MFLSSATHGKETGLTVIYPLVTKNTAKGFGGGVGICTNGVVVTADAAIFGNTALAANATTNPNEYGDQWAFDAKYGIADAAKRQEVNGVMQSQADDFFCAKQSTVFNKMLGGGYYNWTGYTTGGVFKGSIIAVREGGNSVKNELTIDTFPQAAPPNALYNITTGQADLHIPSENAEALDFTGYLVSVTVKNITNEKFPVGTWVGVATDCSSDNLSYEEGTDDNARYPDFRQYLMTLDSNTKGHFTDNSEGLVLKGALKTEGSGTADYDLYKISSFPQTDGALAYGDRLMFLKANPTDEAKQEAYDKAVLFVSGNYSNTNGGGIACNDRIAIGRDPEVPEIPDVPEDPKEERIAALEISKELEGFQESNGSATAVFEVVGYVDKSAADRQVAALEVYRNTIGFSFAADGTDKRTLNDIPEGYYVVRELSYSGDNFDNNQVQKNTWSGQVTGTVVNTEGDTPTEVKPVEVSFTNTYKDETYGTGVVNNYDKNDGNYTYTPDANYQKRHEELSTEEGR